MPIPLTKPRPPPSPSSSPSSSKISQKNTKKLPLFFLSSLEISSPSPRTTMSLLHLPDSIRAPNLKVWSNAAFDSADGVPLQPIRNISSASPDLDPSKENRSPGFLKNQSFAPSMKGHKATDTDFEDKDIDAEIEDTEKEIARLSARLEMLRIKKAERDAKAAAAAASARRGRIVPAKFMEPSVKKIEQSPGSVRRGVSLGPTEILKLGRRKSVFFKRDGIEEEDGALRKEKDSILSVTPRPWPSIVKPSMTPIGSKDVAETPATIRRRGLSLGPSEIVVAAKLQQQRKLQEIKEKPAAKTEKARSASTSPKPRRPVASKVSDLRKGIATLGSKKPTTRENAALANLKPKILFQETKNQASTKRPLKSEKVRVVASRYNPGSKRRKWSLPENGKTDTSVAQNKRSLSFGQSPVTEMDGKDEESPKSIANIGALLPKIRTTRCASESPRDSGCAKRAADLVGRKSHFGAAAVAGEGEASPRQSLNFDEE